MVEARVIRFHEIPPAMGHGAAEVKLLVNESTGARVISSAMATLLPGAKSRSHHHGEEEMVIVLEGKLVLEMGGHQIDLEQYDTCFFPAGVAHRFINSSGSVARTLRVSAGTRPTTVFSDA